MELIALLSSGQGTWAQVSGLIKHGDWDKIILIGDDSSSQFQITEKKDKTEFIKVDLNKKLVDLKEDLLKKLKNKFEGMEVACSIASGDGKEHMALISALISIPVGIRFTALTKDGVVYL
jgi:hypothetical protein